MALMLGLGSSPPAMGLGVLETKKCGGLKGCGLKVLALGGGGDGDGEFPSFLPKEVEKIKDPYARSLAQRIERFPVQVSSFI